MSRQHVGCCISAHGYGHAARTMGIMGALFRLADIELTVATMVPEWFLRSSFAGSLSRHVCQTDVGLVQRTALDQDLPATLAALAQFYPVRPEYIRYLARIFSDCSIVICDIAPAGILAAREAGIPSVLVENFTWEWIYEGYLDSYPEMQSFVEYLRGIDEQADHRVQTEPVCDPVDSALLVPPVARDFHESRESVRQRLGIADDQRLVLVTMGGIGIEQLPIDRMRAAQGTVFTVTGYKEEMLPERNLRFLPPVMDFLHPDLVRASDAVIGKVGYSTLAEVYHADVPFGYVSRQNFRESDPLVSFVRREMRGLEIAPEDFWQGAWVEQLPLLFQMGRQEVVRENGADRCARFLLSLLPEA